MLACRVMWLLALLDKPNLELARLFVKVPQPVDSKSTFSVFEDYWIVEKHSQ